MAVNETELKKDIKIPEKKAPGFFKRKKKILIIIGIIIVCIAGGVAIYTQMTNPVIANAPEKIHDTKDGTIRLRTNPAIIVEGRKLTNIEFSNLNKDRDMQICMKLSEKDDDYLYESPIIEEGKVLISDYIDFFKYREDKSELAPGKKTEVLAELYSYDNKGNKLNQTNCKLTLVVKNK